LKKLRDTGTVNTLTGSGRPRCAALKKIVDLVNDLVLSQEDTSQTQERSVKSHARQTFG